MNRSSLAVLAVLIYCPVAFANLQYDILSLGYRRDSAGTWPTLINDSQVIIGLADIGTPSDQTPFILSGSAPVPLATTPGNSVFSPSAINDAGTMAGFLMADAQNPLPPFYSAALYHNGKYMELKPPGGNPMNDFRANAINNDGEAVGFVRESYSQLRAIIWINNQPAFLDPDSNESSIANAINNDGWIAGAIGPASGADANSVIWHDGAVTNIPLPADAISGTALAINNSGQVLVSYNAVDGHVFANGTEWETRLLIWDQGIETLLPEFSDHIFGTFADSMNDSGIVVGTSANHAVLWENGQIYDLNDLIAPDSGWVLTNATSINDSGDIVGYGAYDNIERPFLLTPTDPTSIPEPATFLLAPGFCLLASFRRRRKVPVQ